MQEVDLIQNWLDSVAISHSGASATQKRYRGEMEAFLRYINASAEDILRDYGRLGEREFKQKYAQLLQSYLGSLMRKDYVHGTIGNFVYAVKSFFKYSDLPIGFVPPVRYETTYHNRDIGQDEIVKILQVSAPRERAFYSFMAQSGLRPTTICNLRLKHLEPDFSQNKVPCLVNVPEEVTKGQYHGYITFVGEDAVRHLKAYFNTRRGLTKESFLFVNQGSEEPMIYNTVSSLFRKAVRMLREKGVMDYEQKKADRPAEIRLYNLRKWFRKQAIHAGFENVEFWMGHTGPGVDEAYRPKDPEFYRQMYAEQAMPFLRLEEPTPTVTEKQIQEQSRQIEALRQELDGYKQREAEMAQKTENLESLLRRVEELEKKITQKS